MTDFPQSRWQIFPKSVADFLEIRGRCSRNPCQIFPKSVADFPKICGRFSQNPWQIFSELSANYPSSCLALAKGAPKHRFKKKSCHPTKHHVLATAATAHNCSTFCFSLFKVHSLLPSPSRLGSSWCASQGILIYTCLCPRLSTSSFLRFSMHFPSVFHSMSYSGRRVNIHESFSHDSCSHRLCFGHIQRPSEACLDQLLGHGSYTRCVHNLLDKSVKAVSSLVSALSCHSDIHSAFTAKIEFGETIGYSTMSLTLRLISPQTRGVRQVES